MMIQRICYTLFSGTSYVRVGVFGRQLDDLTGLLIYNFTFIFHDTVVEPLLIRL